MKKIVTLFLVLGLVVALIGCAGSTTNTTVPSQSASVTTASTETTQTTATTEETSKEYNFPDLKIKTDNKLKIGYLAPELTNESTKRHWQQIQNECQHRGWELISDTNATYEADKTRTAFQRILSQDPDAIVFSFLDFPPIADLIIEARNKGIGVYNIGSGMIDGNVACVLSENGVIGVKMAAYAINRMGGSGKVAGFMDLWMPRGIQRDVTSAALFEDSNYEFKETVHHKLTPEGYTDELYSVASNWITKYGNDLDYIWVCWDLGAITVARAMAEKGYTEKDMFTVGIDGGSQPWAVLREGKIPFVASLAEPFEYQVHMIMETVKQCQVDNILPGDPGSIVPGSGFYSTDNMTFIVDKNNVPAVGANIHSVFNYYGGDPNDSNAWYNWGTPYTVTEGEAN